MAVLLALLSAVCYGTGDFSAGLASRRYTAGPVTAGVTALGTLLACLAVLIMGARAPNASELLWGALSGLGSAVGTFALYHGLSVGRMSVVATLSAILTAVIPALLGVILGNRLGVVAAGGIVIAIPAIALVSWQSGEHRQAGQKSGAPFGAIAGLGFALLLIALDRAGTRAGAWPLVPGEGVAVLLLLPVAGRGIAGHGRPSGSAVRLTLLAGTLAGTGNLLYLAATGHGQLAVVAVLTALYPAMTVILARVVLAEHWSRRQVVGLVSAALSVLLVSLR
ncbi:MAG TPA: DMT family transporter [Solirubrobacteraceae bacterium]|nr:DMT family transporter [Solirubrobacteraceae bacterium]